jgi:Na+-transporting methylmalonyl-CoA/oxaloacetate decarboxylase gamma subunit
MEHLGWGLQMTVLGMGLVFSLLALLWLMLTLVLGAEKEEDKPAQAAVEDDDEEYEEEAPEVYTGSPLISGMPGDLVAAVAMAVTKHRLELRRQAAPIMCASAPDGGAATSRWLAGGRARQNNSWQPKGK